MQYYLLIVCIVLAFVFEAVEAQWGYGGGMPYGGYGNYGGGYGGGYGGYGMGGMGGYGGYGMRRRMMGMYNPYMMYGK